MLAGASASFPSRKPGSPRRGAARRSAMRRNTSWCTGVSNFQYRKPGTPLVRSAPTWTSCVASTRQPSQRFAWEPVLAAQHEFAVGPRRVLVHQSTASPWRGDRRGLVVAAAAQQEPLAEEAAEPRTRHRTRGEPYQS